MIYFILFCFILFLFRLCLVPFARGKQTACGWLPTLRQLPPRSAALTEQTGGSASYRSANNLSGCQSTDNSGNKLITNELPAGSTCHSLQGCTRTEERKGQKSLQAGDPLIRWAAFWNPLAEEGQLNLARGGAENKHIVTLPLRQRPCLVLQPASSCWTRIGGGRQSWCPGYRDNFFSQDRQRQRRSSLDPTNRRMLGSQGWPKVVVGTSLVSPLQYAAARGSSNPR